MKEAREECEPGLEPSCNALAWEVFDGGNFSSDGPRTKQSCAEIAARLLARYHVVRRDDSDEDNLNDCAIGCTKLEAPLLDYSSEDLERVAQRCELRGTVRLADWEAWKRDEGGGGVTLAIQGRSGLKTYLVNLGPAVVRGLAELSARPVEDDGGDGGPPSVRGGDDDADDDDDDDADDDDDDDDADDDDADDDEGGGLGMSYGQVLTLGGGR